MNLLAYNETSASERSGAFIREATWRCATLEALHAWIHGYVCFLPYRRAAALCTAIAEALQPVLDLFIEPDNGRTFRDPLKKGEDKAVAAVLATFQQKLLDVYLAMPYAEAFEASWGAMLELCVEPLREGGSHMHAHSRKAVHCLLLSQLLNSQDDALVCHLSSPDDGFAMVRVGRVPPSRWSCAMMLAPPRLHCLTVGYCAAGAAEMSHTTSKDIMSHKTQHA
jgi:hypothetical protein